MYYIINLDLDILSKKKKKNWIWINTQKFLIKIRTLFSSGGKYYLFFQIVIKEKLWY